MRNIYELIKRNIKRKDRYKYIQKQTWNKYLEFSLKFEVDNSWPYYKIKNIYSSYR